MVKIGFICEGESEFFFVNSARFKQFLKDCKLELVCKPIDAKGNGNLLPHNRDDYDKQLIKRGATKIFILTDLDNDASEAIVRKRIKPGRNHILVVAKKMIESWLLSNDVRMFQLTNKVFNGDTELLNDPASVLKNMLIKAGHRGLNKKQVVEIVIGKDSDLNGFDIQNSKCDSAKLFVKKLKELGAGTFEAKAKLPKNKNK